MDLNVMTFHCGQCNTILGDSLGACGEVISLDTLICTKLTHEVTVSEKLDSGQEGKMANCAYNVLNCSGCQSVVGAVIYSAPEHLAMVRSLFLLHKEKLNCYMLSSGKMKLASTLKFDLMPIEKKIKELRQQLKDQLDHLSQIDGRRGERSNTSEH